MSPPSMVASCCIAAAIRGNKNLDQDENFSDQLLNELHKTINSELVSKKNILKKYKIPKIKISKIIDKSNFMRIKYE